MMHDLSQKKMFKVLTPIPKKDGSKFWMRLGTAFPGKEGALNVYLDALPSHEMMLYIRELDEKDLERRKDRAESTTPPADDLPF